MSNSLHTIKPYWYNELWVFDDAAYSLVKEPFVFGSTEIISAIAEHAGVSSPKAGFRLIFSHKPIPGNAVKLVRGAAESGGYWYRCEAVGLTGWLCPATLHYFPDGHPEEIYAVAESL